MRIRRNGLRTNISEENIQLLQDDLNTFKGLMLTSPMKEATHINNKLTNKWEIVTDKCSKPSRKLREQIPTPVIPITNRYNALHNLQNNPELPGELQNHYIKNQHIQKNVLSKQNKTKTSPKRRKKKILLIGDSHMHDCANELGVCGILIGHPADTVKVRQQIFQSSGSMHIVVQTMKYEGLHGFYKGMGFPLLTSGAQNSFFFGVYGNTLRALENYHKQHNPENSDVSKYWYTNVFLAGSFAGTVQVAIATPIELVKIKLQSQTGSWEKQHLKKYAGPINCILHTIKEHGLRGLYHGSHVMLYRDSLSSGLYVLTYAACLDFLYGPDHVWTVMFAGGTAGVISWASIMPLDVVKSRIQADSLSNPEYKGIVDCMIKSYKRDGLRVFGRGFVMCSFRSFLVNAATFLGYEWSLRFCQHMASRTQGYITSKRYWKEGKLTKVSPELAATEKPQNLTDHRN